jgi:glyoxylase I family protein
MDATGISHIAICVRDLDRSLSFYRDILGMRVASDRIQDTSTGGLPHVYKHSRKTRRQVRLMYGHGDTSPTLTMTSHPGETPDGDPIKLDQIGISHLSFSVPDVKALAEELLSKGVQTAGPLEARTDAQGNLSNFYVYDPDGILIQFDGGGGV